MIAPKTPYHDFRECVITVYDVEDPAAVAQLHRARTAWGPDAELEALDATTYALITRPGGARRLAA
jgi:hypothetical protein